MGASGRRHGAWPTSEMGSTEEAPPEWQCNVSIVVEMVIMILQMIHETDNRMKKLTLRRKIMVIVDSSQRWLTF